MMKYAFCRVRKNGTYYSGCTIAITVSHVTVKLFVCNVAAFRIEDITDFQHEKKYILFALNGDMIEIFASPKKINLLSENLLRNQQRTERGD